VDRSTGSVRGPYTGNVIGRALPRTGPATTEADLHASFRLDETAPLGGGRREGRLIVCTEHTDGHVRQGSVQEASQGHLAKQTSSRVSCSFPEV